LNWLEVRLTVNGELAEAVADLLARHAPGGVAIQPERQGEAAADPAAPLTVSAYLPADEQLEARRTAIENGLWHLGMIAPLPAATFQPVDDQDWAEAWKVHYHPLAIGRRLLVLPAWLPSPDADRLPIVLDPGMAFGTGTHPSTQLCLAALEDHLRPDDEVIDLGCGSGILSIAAARLGARRIRALDIDPLAVRITAENAERNGVAGAIQVSAGSLEDVLEACAPSADVLVANILAPVIEAMARQGLARAVRPGGKLILAGILAEQAESVLHACLAGGLRILEERRSGDWVALVTRSEPPHAGA
jgi:ribosomal protein L11 methyltransferase